MSIDHLFVDNEFHLKGISNVVELPVLSRPIWSLTHPLPVPYPSLTRPLPVPYPTLTRPSPVPYPSDSLGLKGMGTDTISDFRPPPLNIFRPLEFLYLILACSLPVSYFYFQLKCNYKL